MRVLDTRTTIAPFGDPLAGLRLFGQTFTDLRNTALRALKEDPERLAAADYAWASTPILDAFLGSPGTGPKRLAVPANAPTRVLRPGSSVQEEDGLLLYDIFRDARPDRDLAALRAEANPLVVDLPFAHERLELPRLGPAPHALDIPNDGLVAIHFEHWVQLLWGLPALVPEQMRLSKYPTRRSKRRCAPNKIAKTAKIHPTAHLEGALIDEDVTIGAHCSVRHSYIGAKSHLADLTKITRCYIGPASHTLVDAQFQDVVALGEATLAGLLLKDTLVGRGSFVTSAVIFWGEALGESIPVRNQQGHFDSERKRLGGCIGHRCVLGTRTIIGPGQAIPNDSVVVMRKEEGVAKIDRLPPHTPMCWHAGRLVDASTIQKDPHRD